MHNSLIYILLFIVHYDTCDMSLSEFSGQFKSQRISEKEWPLGTFHHPTIIIHYQGRLPPRGRALPYMGHIIGMCRCEGYGF